MDLEVGVVLGTVSKKRKRQIDNSNQVGKGTDFLDPKKKLSPEFSLRNIPQRPKQHYIHNSPCKVPTSFICARPFALP